MTFRRHWLSTSSRITRLFYLLLGSAPLVYCSGGALPPVIVLPSERLMALPDSLIPEYAAWENRGECPRTLRDPQGQTTFLFVRGVTRQMIYSNSIKSDTTFESHADYRVKPDGAYGIRGGQALRVDCPRLMPLSVVPRFER